MQHFLSDTDIGFGQPDLSVMVFGKKYALGGI